MWSTKKLALGVAAGLLLVATACGGGSGGAAQEVSTQGDEVISEQTSVPATTAVATVTTQPPAADDAPEAGTAEALGLLERSQAASAGRSVRGHMSIRMAGLDQSTHFEADGDGNVATKLSFAESTDDPSETDFGSLDVEVRVVDGRMYMSYTVPKELRGLFDGGMPEGWFTVDDVPVDALQMLCAPTGLSGGYQKNFCQAPNENMFPLEFITSAGITGRDDLDGVSTTVVDFTVDYVAMTKAFMTEAAEAFGEDEFGDGLSEDDPFGMDDLFGADGEHPDLAMTAWIDDSDLVRRLSVDLGSLYEAFGQAFADDLDFPDEMADFVQLIDFYDYDADITIEAPPADQIIGDLSDLEGRHGSGDSGSLDDETGSSST